MTVFAVIPEKNWFRMTQNWFKMTENWLKMTKNEF